MIRHEPERGRYEANSFRATREGDTRQVFDTSPCTLVVPGQNTGYGTLHGPSMQYTHLENKENKARRVSETKGRQGYRSCHSTKNNLNRINVLTLLAVILKGYSCS